MITKEDLQEAIAECQGERNPNANTAIKLAAFLTIQRELFPQDQFSDIGRLPSYAYAEPPDNYNVVGDHGGSDFLQAVKGKDPSDMWKAMDELMDTLKMVNERVYNSVMRKIQ
ncbi:MAG: hypothetical protein J6P40_04405 [Oscillospiraceae bacterium]|nr:hypothetical protein [Oscillospiraceae bacterium]